MAGLKVANLGLKFLLELAAVAASAYWGASHSPVVLAVILAIAIPAAFVTTRDEVMTAREVAELLRIPTSTAYELARKGVLPASWLGRTWQVSASAVGGAARSLSMLGQRVGGSELVVRRSVFATARPGLCGLNRLLGFERELESSEFDRDGGCFSLGRGRADRIRRGGRRALSRTGPAVNSLYVTRDARDVRGLCPQDQRLQQLSHETRHRG